MATVPKVLFMEQKYTCIFLLKFRHQSMIRDLHYTKPATPGMLQKRKSESVCSKKPTNTRCVFFLLNYKPYHQREEKSESTKPLRSFQCLLHWFKTFGVAKRRGLLRWRIQGPTQRNYDSEDLQLDPRTTFSTSSLSDAGDLWTTFWEITGSICPSNI